MYSMLTIMHYSEAAYVERSPPWINALYACTLFTNFSATGERSAIHTSSVASSWPAPVLLAFRVWRVNSRASEFRRTYSRLRIFLRVVIESGTIYTILNLALLISLRLNSPLVWYLRDIVS